MDRFKDGHVALVMNTTGGTQGVSDARAVALGERIAYYTTAAGAHAAALTIRAREEGEVEVEVGVRSLQA